MPLLLYRDAHLVAVHKPAGLLVHRSRIDRHETRFALQQVRNLVGQHVFPVHRLDKPTSGVLLFALDADTARRLGAAFAARRVCKTYVAVVRGHPAVEGTIDHPLREALDPFTDTRAGKDPQPATTTYRRLATVELPVAVDRYPTSRYALVEAHPLTGRKHQIRRHMKHIAHPIIGDGKYGKGRHNRFFADRLDVNRLLLHAVELTVSHPHTGADLTFTAPLDATWQGLLDRMGWHTALPSRWIG